MKKTGKRQAQPEHMRMGMLAAVGRGSAAALGAFAVLLLVFSCLIWWGTVSQRFIEMGAWLSCAAASAVGGLAAVRGGRERAFPLGLSSGAILFLALLTLGLMSSDGSLKTGEFAEILTACTCGGAAAVILGRKKKKKRRI